MLSPLLFLLSAAAAEPEPTPPAWDTVIRAGAAVALDKHHPSAGLHVDTSHPYSRQVRTTMRGDYRGWWAPTSKETAFWDAQDISDLPLHHAFELNGSAGARLLFTEWERADLGAEVGFAIGLWHHGTVAVQDEYSELGATLFPLQEFLGGPEIQLGLYNPSDSLSFVWLHRAWLPALARLDGTGEPYRINDERFDPVDLVNPVMEAGLVGHYQLDHLYLRAEATWRLDLPSKKNRAIDQSPPDGTVHLDLGVGYAF